jgi:Nicotinamide mononucleotide transporter
MTELEIVETVGSVLGALGALLLATNSRWSGWAFVLFLVSNVAWLVFGREAGHWRFFAMQIVFTLTSLLGLWRWLIAPPAPRVPSKSDRIAMLPPIVYRPLPVLTPEELARMPPASSEDRPDVIFSRPGAP